VPFILIATFTMLNLFIAVIVSAMQTFNAEDSASTVAAVDEARDHVEADVHAQIGALRKEIAELKALLLARPPAGR